MKGYTQKNFATGVNFGPYRFNIYQQINSTKFTTNSAHFSQKATDNNITFNAAVLLEKLIVSQLVKKFFVFYAIGSVYSKGPKIKSYEFNPYCSLFVNFI